MKVRGDAARSILRQLVGLVRISSRAHVDDFGPILAAVRSWLTAENIPCSELRDGDRVVGICGEVTGGRKGPTYLLNATVDTAEFGDVSRWSRRPLSGAIDNGWVLGRGTADSKSGVAIFCHVIAALTRDRLALRGNLAFLFDAEEHSGEFTGVRRFMTSRGKSSPLAGVMIGYPGNEGIVIGCRGFFRAVVSVHGKSAHSGSTRHRGVNAVDRAAVLVERLGRVKMPSLKTGGFHLPPQVTVTAITGGTDFSTVPDLCRVNVDFRLTPSFTRAHAERALRREVASLDRGRGAVPPTDIQTLPGWPAYRLADNSPMFSALRASASRVFGRDVPGVLAGPSSIGNYLSTLGIPTTSGFGVTYRNLHATDEGVEVASIEPVYQTYVAAARQLLS